MSGQTDLRGFSYELEPIRTRRAWQLDAAFARQTRVQQELTALDCRLADLDAECKAQAQSISAAWSELANAGRYERQLQYLSDLHATRSALLEQKGQVAQSLADSRRAAAAAQHKLEALHRHRQEVVDEYATVQIRQSICEADRDWIARESTGSSPQEHR